MEMALTFNDITFSPVPNQIGIWIRATELAKALGYGRDNQISRLYRSNADEFAPNMTQVIEIFDSPDTMLPIKSRIFSLRGCHLIAMFARTPVAKAFRKWVLDVLDRITKEEQVKQAATSADRLSKRTDPERRQLTGIINTWVGLAPIHYATARAQVNAHFGVTGIDELTVAQVKEAVQWVQGKIDALPPASTETLPPAIAAKDVELTGKYQSFLEEVERWRQSNRAEYDRLYRMAVALLDPARTGTAMTDACAAMLASWLEEAGLSHISVFDKHLNSSRAPILLIANLNARFESAEKYLKRG